MKRIIFFLTLVVFSLSVTVLPVMAGDTSTEIEQLNGNDIFGRNSKLTI